MPDCINVMGVCLLFFIILGVVGVQNFKGVMRSCNDPTVTIQANCTGMFNLTGDLCSMAPTDAAAAACKASAYGHPDFPRIWASKSYNYDNIGYAILTLYEIASGEMWPDIMADTVSGMGGNQWVSLYYITVQVILAFLMINVFVGVVIESYNKQKSLADGGMLTEDQKKWREAIKLALMSGALKAPKEPAQDWRKPFFKVSISKELEVTIMTLIMLNALLLAARFQGMPSTLETVLKYGNQVFAYIFLVEAVVKLIGLGFYQYFDDSWNIFDFTLVVLSLVGDFIDLGTIATLFRIFRVARVFRIVRTSKGLHNLFKT